MDWREAIKETLLLEGRQLFREVMRSRSAAPAPEGALALAPARKLLAQAKQIGPRAAISASLKKVSSLVAPEQRKSAALSGVTLSGKLGGFAVGYCLPHWNVKFVKARRPLDRIVLPSVPLISAEIFLAWVHAVLERSRTRLGNSDEGLAPLNAMEKFFLGLRMGITKGSSARNAHFAKLPLLRRLVQDSPGVPLNDAAYETVEQMFLSLVRKSW